MSHIVSRWTVKRVLKQAGFRWRRVRKSLREQQDPVLMAFFKQELGLLKQAHRQAQIDLWFYDETGLGLNPAGVYAWQGKDYTAHLPAQRGQGFTVAGFLTLENQLQANPLKSYVIKNPPCFGIFCRIEVQHSVPEAYSLASRYLPFDRLRVIGHGVID